MTSSRIKKNHALYIAGKILNIIVYATSVFAFFILTLTCFLLAGFWDVIPEIASEVSEDVMSIMTVTFIFGGILILLLGVAIAVVGGIALKKVNNATTKEELLPWAIVSAIFISSTSGVLLILASTLRVCREQEVEIVG